MVGEEDQAVASVCRNCQPDFRDVEARFAARRAATRTRMDAFELLAYSSYIILYEIVETQMRILGAVHTARQWPPL